ncbi:MAG: GNAT family acetyltransferase [Pseudomonadota bacterium]|nr:GNAT family acetyltransferase [Pseudomonadota bacterium]
MRPGCTIHPLRKTESEQIVRLWEICGLTRPWNDPRQDIAFCRDSPTSELLVLPDQNGAVAGTIMVGHDGHRGWVYYLAVLPALQGQGHGKRLVNAGEAWLQACGVQKINLMVRTGNTDVCDFYRRLGYADSGVTVLAKWLE